MHRDTVNHSPDSPAHAGRGRLASEALAKRSKSGEGACPQAPDRGSAPSPGFHRSASLRSESDLSPHAGRGGASGIFGACALNSVAFFLAGSALAQDATAPTGDVTATAPAISMPCGQEDERPIGLMLVGRPFDEATIFRAAAAFEDSGDWRTF